MRSMLKCLALLLCVVLLAGCQEPVPTTTVPETTQTPLTAREKYDLARTQVEEAANLVLAYTLTEKRQVGKDTFLRDITGTASFVGIGSRNMEAVVEEQLRYGSYQSAYRELFCDGKTFAVVNGSAFTADLTPAEFCQRQLPAVMLDYELYAEVTESAVEGGVVLTFAGASAAESWLQLPNEAKLISAGGTMTLSGYGTLTQSEYTVEYTLGDVRYSTRVTGKVTTPAGLDLGAIHNEHFEDCPKLEVLDAPKRLLQVVGDVYTSLSISCKATERIYSEAIPLTYSQKSKYTLQGQAEAMIAGATYNIQLSDYRGQSEKVYREESYENGTYTKVENGSTKQSAISPEAMRQYYEDAILSALLAPKYMENATSWKGVSEYHLEMTANDAFAQELIRDIAEFLQVQLGGANIKIAPDGCGGYVDIDRNTGLPVSMGLFLECTHTVEEIEYSFTYTLEQELTLSNYK